MKQLLYPRLLALALLVLTASGCFNARVAVPPEHPPSAYDVIDSFEVQRKASWVIFGLVPVSEAHVEEIVDREVRRVEGDAATNVVVTGQADLIDLIVGAITGGLFNTYTYTVSGDVVRFQGGSAAAQPVPGVDPRVILGGIQYRGAATQP